MNKTVAIVLLVVAIVVLATGLLFLCAASQRASRLPLSIALLVIGAALAAWSGLTLRRLWERDPERLGDRITALARARDGEVTLSAVVAELGVPDEAAAAAFSLLEERGQCYAERRGERGVQVFPGLLPSVVVRRCAHCGSEYSVKTPLSKCPNCGGRVELVRR